MKNLLLISVILLLPILSFSQRKADAITTYFFIRHAEKAYDGTKNPHLSMTGTERALQWAHLFKNQDFDAIYATDYHRTRETATAILKDKGLKLQYYDPKVFDLKKFMNDTKGKKVLIIGHSNTTPMYVNAILGTTKYKKIEENTYGNLYLVTLYDKEISDILLCMK